MMHSQPGDSSTWAAASSAPSSPRDFSRDTLVNPGTDPALARSDSRNHRKRVPVSPPLPDAARNRSDRRPARARTRINPRACRVPVRHDRQHLAALPHDTAHPSSRARPTTSPGACAPPFRPPNLNELCTVPAGQRRREGLARAAFRCILEPPAIRLSTPSPSLYFSHAAVSPVSLADVRGARRREISASALDHVRICRTRLPLSQYRAPATARNGMHADLPACTDFSVLPAPSDRSDSLDYFGNHVSYFSLQESHNHADASSRTAR